ncbi:IS481 family transposase [Tepidimonas sp. HKU77]|uniref:IS481 family transposase n=1 Tax=Tepidimonas sp. HKU77 TaxID=3414503 RepID=UPI003C7CE40B
MIIRLHKNATTTPATRAYIQSSSLSVAALAAELGVSEDTIRRWKRRDFVEDRPHTAHRLQTTLTPAQELLVVELRKTLQLPLDDLLVVTREFINPRASRSGLYRLLKRHGLSQLPSEAKDAPASKPFKTYMPGYLHIDVKYLPQMPDEHQRRYLFVAIDRATRWVFIQIKPNKTAAAARSFLKALHKTCPVRITHILTDNGKEFTDRLFASGARAPSGKHEFDQLCQALGIEHRLTKPRHPQTNGMVERFNGRIAEVLATHHFNSAEDLETTLTRYVWLYNHHLPQKAIGHITPLEALKKWYAQRPDLFIFKPRNRPGPDI